jgi:hypothetical protein
MNGKPQPLRSVLDWSCSMSAYLEASTRTTYDVEFASALFRWVCQADKPRLSMQHWMAIPGAPYVVLREK